jgi:cell wall-associated NlpC family hydrolase
VTTPGSSTYDVLYRATADFGNLRREAESAKMSLRELQAQEAEMNRASVEGSQRQSLERGRATQKVNEERDAVSRLALAVKAYSDQVRNVPGRTTTEAAFTDDQARSSLEKYKALLDEVTNTVRTDASFEGSAATSSLEAYRANLMSLPSEVRTNLGVDVDDASLASANAKIDYVARDRTARVKLEEDGGGAGGGFLRRLLGSSGGGSSGDGFSLSSLAKMPTMLTAIAALGPALIPLASGLLPLIGEIGTSFAGAGAGALSFGAMAKTALTEAGTNTQQLEKLQTAVEQATTAKSRATAQQRLADFKDSLTKQQLAFSETAGTIEKKWKDTSSRIAIPALVPWLDVVKRLLKEIDPLVQPVAAEFENWGKLLDQYFKSPQGNARIKDLLTELGHFSAIQLHAIITFFVDVAAAVGNLGRYAAQYGVDFGAFGVHLTRWGEAFKQWSESKEAREDVGKFLEWVHRNGAQVAAFFGNLGGALAKVAPGLTTAGALELRALTDFLGLIGHLPPSIATHVTELALAFVAFAKPIGLIAQHAPSVLNLLSKIPGFGFLKQATAAEGMQAAGDTMLTAAGEMQRAADTMVGAGARGGAAGAEGAAAGAASGGRGRALLLGAGGTAIVATIVGQVLGALAPQATRQQTRNYERQTPGAVQAPLDFVFGGHQQAANVSGFLQQSLGANDKNSPFRNGGPWDPEVWFRKIEHFFTVSVPHFFMQGVPGLWSSWYESFMQNFGSPVARFFTKTLPGDAGDVARFWHDVWFSAWHWFDFTLVQPVTGFFTRTLPRVVGDVGKFWHDLWFDAWHWFDSHLVQPVVDFFETRVLAALDQEAKGWHDLWFGAWHWFDSRIIQPVLDFFTTKVLAALDQEAKGWHDLWFGAWHWFDSRVIQPMQNFFTKTVPDWLGQVAKFWHDLWFSAWRWFDNRIVQPVHDFFTSSVPHAFGQVGSAWHDLWAGAWRWLDSHIVQPFTNFWTHTVPGIFGTVSDQFRSRIINPVHTWLTALPSMLGNAFKTGLNWVIGNVINQVIRWVNKIPLIPNIPLVPQLAKGGVLAGVGTAQDVANGGFIPGYAPGQDTRIALVSPGEGVLVPEAVRGIGGPATIHALNRKYGGHRGAGYAAGGIVDDVPRFQLGGILGGIEHGIASAADMVTGWFDKGLKFIGDAFWNTTIQPAISHATGPREPDNFVGNALYSIASGMHGRFDQMFEAMDKKYGGSGSSIVEFAKKYVGKVPYVWGGTTPAGWDCSGMTGWDYRHFGYNPPRTSQQQQMWAQASGDQPGALVFFYGRNGTASHVGISMGNGLYIGADSPAIGTAIRSSASNTGFGVPPGGFTKGPGNAAPGAPAGGGTWVELGRAMAAQRGWTGQEWNDLYALWQRESGWNPNAQNPHSGAAGIPQDITGNFHGGGRGQIQWGLDYIAGRYGDPAGAWAHENRFGWYGLGGVVPYFQDGGVVTTLGHSGQPFRSSGVHFVNTTPPPRHSRSGASPAGDPTADPSIIQRWNAIRASLRADEAHERAQFTRTMNHTGAVGATPRVHAPHHKHKLTHKQEVAQQHRLARLQKRLDEQHRAQVKQRQAGIDQMNRYQSQLVADFDALYGTSTTGDRDPAHLDVPTLADKTKDLVDRYLHALRHNKDTRWVRQAHDTSGHLAGTRKKHNFHWVPGRQDLSWRHLDSQLSEIDKDLPEMKRLWNRIWGPGGVKSPTRFPRTPHAGVLAVPPLRAEPQPSMPSIWSLLGASPVAAEAFAGGGMVLPEFSFLPTAAPLSYALGGYVEDAIGRIAANPPARGVSDAAASVAGGITTGDITINNPVREPAGDSLTRSLNRLSFMAGR